MQVISILPLLPKCLRTKALHLGLLTELLHIYYPLSHILRLKYLTNKSSISFLFTTLPPRRLVLLPQDEAYPRDHRHLQLSRYQTLAII